MKLPELVQALARRSHQSLRRIQVPFVELTDSQIWHHRRSAPTHGRPQAHPDGPVGASRCTGFGIRPSVGSRLQSPLPREP